MALFVADFVLDTSEAGGPPPIAGRDAAVAMTRDVIETARTAHQAHSPEIRIDGDTAHGVWAMQDRVVFADGSSLTGYGHYTETHVRRDGECHVATSKLTRLHLDFTPASA